MRPSRSSYDKILIICAFFIGMSCVSEYDFVLDEKVSPKLSVDAFLELHNERARIYLHESSTPIFGKGSASPTVIADSVCLISETGEVIKLDLTYDNPSPNTPLFYSFLSIEINPNKQYKLHISYNGEIYESELESATNAPSIDSQYIELRYESVINEFGSDQETPMIDFFIDFQANEENTYYWIKYKNYYLDKCSCYLPRSFNSLILINNDENNNTSFNKSHVNTVIPTDNLMSREFYSEITLHKISDDLYNFLEPAYVAQQNRGGLFDVIPESLPSNITRLSDGEKALGVFAMSYGSVSEKTINPDNNPADFFIKTHIVGTPPPLLCSQIACIQNGGSLTKPY